MRREREGKSFLHTRREFQRVGPSLSLPGEANGLLIILYRPTSSEAARHMSDAQPHKATPLDESPFSPFCRCFVVSFLVYPVEVAQVPLNSPSATLKRPVGQVAENKRPTALTRQWLGLTLPGLCLCCGGLRIKTPPKDRPAFSAHWDVCWQGPP